MVDIVGIFKHLYRYIGYNHGNIPLHKSNKLDIKVHPCTYKNLKKQSYIEWPCIKFNINCIMVLLNCSWYLFENKHAIIKVNNVKPAVDLSFDVAMWVFSEKHSLVIFVNCAKRFLIKLLTEKSKTTYALPNGCTHCQRDNILPLWPI